MAEIVNLRRVKKARAAAEAESRAASNRAKHGRTKAERSAEAARQDTRDRLLDGARLDQEATANRAKDRDSSS